LKEKNPYLALIFDLVRTPQYNDSSNPSFDDVESTPETNVKKEFSHFQNNYSNKRWALYCTCGQMTEIPFEAISRNGYGKIISSQKTICNSCSKEYKSLSGVKLIYSKEIEGNVTSKRFGVVEKENFYALYSFATIVFVSVTTKKLIFRNISNRSLYLSKKSDTIKIKIKEKIITVPFRFLVKHCSSIVNNMTLNALYENVISQGLFERQVIKPLIKFCELVESKCDQRDVNRINLILEKERDEMYLNSLFRNLSSSPTNCGEESFLNNCHYKPESLSNYNGNMSTSRYIWIQYLKRRLCIMLSLSVYQPIVTLILTYGPDKFLNLLTNSSFVCSLTNLKKKNPTNPKTILETMFKSKVTSEFSKHTKIIKYIKTEEKKRKRKLKAHPQKKDLLFSITTHPTVQVDTRVPIYKDIKLRLKNIQFRKFYVDLFLERNFDEVAQVFYGFLHNNSAFDEIETVDKIILNNNIKDAYDFIVCVQNMYNQSINRIGHFKITHKHFCHILKIFHTSDANFEKILQLYMDTIFMLINVEIQLTEILKSKTFDALVDMHNSLSLSFRLIADKKLSEDLKIHIDKFRHTEGIFDNIKFNLIDTPEKFYEESSVMSHCVKTYCANVAKGSFVIYSVEDLETMDRATLSINIQYSNIDSDGSKKTIYTFNQLKAKHNAKATETIINSVKDFIKKFFEIKEYNNCYDLKLPETIQQAKHIENEMLDFNFNVQELQNIAHNDNNNVVDF